MANGSGSAKLVSTLLVLMFLFSAFSVVTPIQAQETVITVNTWWGWTFQFTVDGMLQIIDDDGIRTVISQDFSTKPDSIRTYVVGNTVVQEFNFGSKGMTQMNYSFFAIEPKVKLSIAGYNYKYNKFKLNVDVSDALAKNKEVKTDKDKDNIDYALKSSKVKFDWSDAINSNMTPVVSYDSVNKKFSLYWSLSGNFTIDPIISSDEGVAPSQVVEYSYGDPAWGSGANGSLVVSSGTVTISSPAEYTYISVASGATLNITSSITVKAMQSITVYGTLQIASDSVILYSPLIFVNGSGKISGDGLGRTGYNFTLVAYNLTCYGVISSGGDGGIGGAGGVPNGQIGNSGGAGGTGYAGGKINLNFTYGYISGQVRANGGGGGGGGGGSGDQNSGSARGTGGAGGAGGKGGVLIIANSTAIQGNPQLSVAGGGGGGGGGGGAAASDGVSGVPPTSGSTGSKGSSSGTGGTGGTGGNMYGWTGDGYNWIYGGNGGAGGAPGSNGTVGATGNRAGSAAACVGGSGGTAGSSGTLSYTTPNPSIPPNPTSGSQSTSYSYYWASSAANTTYLYNFSYSFPSNTIKQLKVTFPKGMSIINVTSVSAGTALQTSEYIVTEYNSTHWVITIPDATINSKGNSYRLYTTATCAVYDLKMGDDSTFPVYLPLNSPANFKAILKDPYGNPIQQSATFIIMDSNNNILSTNTTTSNSSGIALASVTTPSSVGAYYIRANTSGNYAGLLYNTIKVTDIDHSTSFSDERTWTWDNSTLSGYAYYTVDYASLPGKVTINGTDVTLSGGQFSKVVQSSNVGNFSYVLIFNDTKYVTKTTTVYHIFDYPKVTPSFDANGNVNFAISSTFDNSPLSYAYSGDSDKIIFGSFQYGLKSFTWNVLTRYYEDKPFKITTDANSTIVVTSVDTSLRKIIFNATGPANVTVWVGSIDKPYQVKVDGAVVNFVWDDATKTLTVPITSTTVELNFPAPAEEEGRGGGGIIWTPTVPSTSSTSTTPPASTIPPSVGTSPEIVKFGLFAIVLAGVAALVAKEVQERSRLSYKFKTTFKPKKVTKKDWDKARKKKWWG